MKKQGNGDVKEVQNQTRIKQSSCTSICQQGIVDIGTEVLLYGRFYLVCMFFSGSATSFLFKKNPLYSRFHSFWHGDVILSLL